MLKVDRYFFISFIALLAIGIAVFVSASLGTYAKDPAKFTSVAFNHLFFGLVLGSIGCFITSRIDYKIYRRFSFYIFLFTIFVSLLVFVPHLGVYHGGAKRWIYIGSISLQPLEVLKIGFIIYFASWISGVKDKIKTFRFGLLPFLILLGIVGALLLLQPDADSFAVLAFVGLAIYIAGEGRWRDLFIIAAIGAVGLGVLLFMRPYMMDRVATFMNPSDNPLSSGYQIQQSLIAVGSGEMFGRGFGQSIQKYKFLPESMGDSVFAVAGEELGFVGGLAIIILFIFFAGRGLKIAMNTPDTFGRLLAVGIVILIVIQSLMNIASTIGVIPLSGEPLIFFSQGGTALFFTLLEIGILLNISKTFKK